MPTRLSAGVHGAVPMAGLFLAAFSLTWALQRPGGQPGSATVLGPTSLPVSPSNQYTGLQMEAATNSPEDAVTPEEQRAPTLDEMAVDPDPRTSTEAQILLGLLEEEKHAG